MRRNAALLVGLVTGALAGASALRRRPWRRHEPAPDGRADELRRKLAEAREAAADEDEFDDGGATAETAIAERPTRGDSPVAPVGDEVDEARRRIHEEGRAAAEEMRRADRES